MESNRIVALAHCRPTSHRTHPTRQPSSGCQRRNRSRHFLPQRRHIEQPASAGQIPQDATIRLRFARRANRIDEFPARAPRDSQTCHRAPQTNRPAAQTSARRLAADGNISCTITVPTLSSAAACAFVDPTLRITADQIHRREVTRCRAAQHVAHRHARRRAKCCSIISTPRRFGHFSARIVNFVGSIGLPWTSFGYLSSSPTDSHRPHRERHIRRQRLQIAGQQIRFFHRHPRRKHRRDLPSRHASTHRPAPPRTAATPHPNPRHDFPAAAVAPAARSALRREYTSSRSGLRRT